METAVIGLDAYRRFFADEIRACAGLRSAALVEAFATIERERFLPPGPWTTRTEADFLAPSRQTPDADPRHVYHNVVLALDPARQLFNGQPSTLGLWIDALGLSAGARVLHVGTGAGYYTAIMAHVVGPKGRVLGIEIDERLAVQTRDNLRAFSCVEVRHGSAAEALGESFDAILINAGMTHPRTEWLDALAPGGRLVVPLTIAMPPGAPIGKGVVMLVTNDGRHGDMTARTLSMVMIYTAHGVRDEAIGQRLAKALNTLMFSPVGRLRRDAHDESPACVFHGDGFCLSKA